MSDHLPLYALSADPLSEAMEGLDLKSWVPGPFRLTAPWGLQASGDLGWCYLLSEGQCQVQIESSNQAVTLSPGDFVVIPRGQAHCLADGPDSTLL